MWASTVHYIVGVHCSVPASRQLNAAPHLSAVLVILQMKNKISVSAVCTARWPICDFACVQVSLSNQCLCQEVRRHTCNIRNTTDSRQGRVVVGLCAMLSISFVLKWQWVLKTVFDGYHSEHIVILDLISEYQQEQKKNWHFRYHTLLRLAVFREALGHLYE